MADVRKVGGRLGAQLQAVVEENDLGVLVAAEILRANKQLGQRSAG
jgi:hypothetical protein